ncbi:LiaF transmembrane domain-containing protein [Bacillus sp. 1P06AnD]|uniref:LiaF transmembrane domain-containing protein n=1 Tax=Bacillus sp. 1P06AnD TaxID=3132208 RepID=UPI0039A20CF9
MKNLFSPVLLIGFGLYFLLSQSNISLFSGMYTWPSLLCIIGIAFLVQAYKGKQYEQILPGVAFLGFGIHFHVINTIHLWSNNVGVFILIISLGVMLQAQKTNKGMAHGIVLLAVSVFILFNDSFMKTIHSAGILENISFSLVPVVLIGCGILLLFIKNR